MRSENCVSRAFQEIGWGKLLAFPPLITAPLCKVIDLKLANRSGIRTGENVEPNSFSL